MSYVLLTIGTMLFLTLATSYVVLRLAGFEGAVRKLLLFFVVMTLPVAIYAVIRGLFVRPKPIRYREELGKIEDEIESERSATFEEMILHPSFSQRWKMSYLYAVEKNVIAAAKFDRTGNDSLCGIAHLS